MAEDKSEEFNEKKSGKKSNRIVAAMQKFDKMMDGWVGYVFYACLGIFIAFVLYQGLAFGLSTDMPVVAVVSESMQHDASLQSDHYNWLQTHMGYNRSYVDSWPISGGFMRGDMPIVQKLDKYAVGDVIVYSLPNQNVPIIHRIIKINEDGSYMTKGDNNPALLPFEASVSPQQIHGRVIFIIPKLGYFKVILSDTFGLK
jgi:signal peptidase I